MGARRSEDASWSFRGVFVLPLASEAVRVIGRESGEGLSNH